jgi:chaperonin GroEL
MVKTEFGTALKNKLLKGICTLNDSVSSTLGPGGRNVIILDEEGNIKITKDGVTVAKSFNKLEDPVEDIGAQMIRKVSEKSADKAGDGTTTSTLLATVMVQEGIKVITQGSNAVEVKKGIDTAVKSVIEELKKLSRDISSEDQIKQVATISANNDLEIGTIISTALDKVGNDGVVAIEESKTGETSLEVVEGMMFDRGYKSPYFVTNQNTMQAVLEKPLVFLYDGKLVNSTQIIAVLQSAAAQSKPLLIVAEDIEGEALALLVVNKANNTIKVCAVKAPDFGDRRTAILEDMAILTGAQVVSPTKGHKIDKMKPAEFNSLFGEARMVTVSSKDTTIIDGKATPENIENRLIEIKTQIDLAKSNFEIEKLQDRLAKLTGGVAIINVGGLSEVEMKEKKDRVDDALHATKAALDQGIVPGGGMALIRCANALNKIVPDNGDQSLGINIVYKSIFAPLKKILANAGIEDYHAILSKVEEIKKEWDTDGTFSEKGEDDTYSMWFGYDVKNSSYVNFLSAGIIDPTKVTRTALENAASVAGTILTTESVVYTAGETKKEEIDYSQFMQ